MFNLIFYEVELMTQKRNFYKLFELVTRSVTSFSVTRFYNSIGNSRIPNLIIKHHLNVHFKKWLSEMITVWHWTYFKTLLFNIYCNLKRIYYNKINDFDKTWYLMNTKYVFSLSLWKHDIFRLKIKKFL